MMENLNVNNLRKHPVKVLNEQESIGYSRKDLLHTKKTKIDSMQ